MNWNKVGIVVGREYSDRVKKKSFLLITFLSPIFFAALCILPSLIMIGAKEEAKKIAVVDKSGIVLPILEDSEAATYSDFSSYDPDSLKTKLADLGMDAELYVSAIDTATKNVTAVTYSGKPLGVDLVENLEGKVNDAVEDYRIDSYGIDGLKNILSDVEPDIHLATITLGEDGEEKITSSEIYMLISMLLGIIIYMFIAMFGGMVMSSVIEEKSSRVVEVLVSSVKATELMFGKIIGIALVALTQFFLWIVLTLILVAAGAAIFGMDSISAGMAAASDPAMQAQVEQMASSDAGGMQTIMSTLLSINWGQIVIAFVVFFVFGYLLYASLFAAIGSAVENEGDSSQLQLPVTIPLMIAFFIALYCFKAPDSGVVFWGSMIPFTSPIVMLARIPFGVPAWQLILSILLLVVTFFACGWASAKIYKAGILMYGKKSTFKDLWKWLKQK